MDNVLVIPDKFLDLECNSFKSCGRVMFIDTRKPTQTMLQIPCSNALDIIDKQKHKPKTKEN